MLCLYCCSSNSLVCEAFWTMRAQARYRHGGAEPDRPLSGGQASLVLGAVGRSRILLVEDDLMQADQVSDAIRARGLEVVGPVGSLGAAIELANSETLDGALLDVRLQRGLLVFPVVEILRRRRIPFCFMTAYGGNVISAMPAAVVLDKPVSLGALHSAISLFLEA